MTTTATILYVSTLDYFFIEHVAIMIVEDGQEIVYHNTNYINNSKGGSIIRQTFADFMVEREEYRREAIEVDRDKFYAYITANIQRTYNAVFYNCEHFIYELLYGEKRSPQLVKYGLRTIGFSAIIGVVGYQVGKNISRKKRLS